VEHRRVAPPPPELEWFERWYLWAGLGVVIAGALTAIIVAAQPQGPGPLDPIIVVPEPYLPGAM